MRVAISAIQTPFIRGGADFMVRGLKENLESRGFETEIVSIPFNFFPESEVSKSIDIWLNQNFKSFNGREVDKLISLQFPSYYVNHPNKTLWLMHQFRPVYDLYSKESATADLKALRDRVIELDRAKLSEFKSRFSISKTVAKRLLDFNNLDSTPLYHPPYDEKHYYYEEPKDFIFFPSRLEKLKRQDLAIKAFQFVKSPIKLILAGRGGEEKNYLNLIRELNLEDRVIFKGEISQKEKYELYANALGVLFPPYGEDYGYITLEAMLSKKPVITCKDSGATAEFVLNGVTGFISEPQPEAIAEYIDWLYYNRDDSIKMGRRGYEYYRFKDISWDRVISKLMG